MPDLHVSRHSLFSPRRPATIAAAAVMLLALTACGKGEAPEGRRVAAAIRRPRWAWWSRPRPTSGW